MLTIFVGNLSPDTREAELRELFEPYGTVRSLRLVADVFSGKCRGIGFVEMEGHEARAAMAALDGRTFKERSLKVNQEQPRARRGAGRAR
ncbi:MAG: RNA-binding protein [Pseudomonadota bacterium]|nr:MAG: RNA-binding protein [Pseudomonadota bacterium]